MNHLVAYRHVPRSLDDLVPCVVADRQHGADHAANDAAVVRTQVGRRIERSASVVVVVPRPGHGGGTALRFRCHRWNPAVSGIDDERGLPLRSAALAPVSGRAGAGAATAARGDELLTVDLRLRPQLVLSSR